MAAIGRGPAAVEVAQPCEVAGLAGARVSALPKSPAASKACAQAYRMSWWRSIHGAPHDQKFKTIAWRLSLETGVISSIALALLDRAGSAKDRGSIAGYDVETISCSLGWAPDVVEKVIRALHDKRFVADGRIVNWEKYQSRDDPPNAFWLRLWRGAPECPTWGIIARRIKQPTGVVVSVVWELLDRASTANGKDRGSIAGYDAEAISFCLGWAPDVIDAVVAALRERGVLTGDRFTNWEKRQRSNSTERMARSRANKAAEEAERAARAATPVTPCDICDVCDASESDQESESDSESDQELSVVLPFRAPDRVTDKTDGDKFLIEKLNKAAGLSAAAETGKLHLRRARYWLAKGADLEQDILPQIAKTLGRLRNPRAVFRARYLDSDIMAARDARLAQRARDAPGAPISGELSGRAAPGQWSTGDPEMDAMERICRDG